MHLCHHIKKIPIYIHIVSCSFIKGTYEASDIAIYGYQTWTCGYLYQLPRYTSATTGTGIVLTQ